MLDTLITKTGGYEAATEKKRATEKTVSAEQQQQIQRIGGEALPSIKNTERAKTASGLFMPETPKHAPIAASATPPYDTSKIEQVALDALPSATSSSDSIFDIASKDRGVLHNYPDVAQEMLKLGLDMEAFQTDKLEEFKKQGDGYREKIQNLLRFSALLDKLPPDQKTWDLKKELLDKWTESSMTREEIEQCIQEVFPKGSDTISKEQLSGGKIRANDIMSEYKTRMTTLLTTEISILIHHLQMVTQFMQKINDQRHQLISATVRNGH